MPLSFKHISLGGGHSYENPIKYIQDILKLESQLHERFRDGATPEQERYHLFYLCKSFNYTGYSLNDEFSHKFFPYGKDQLKSFLERGIFYYDKFLSTFKDTGENWYLHYLKAELLGRLTRTEESLAEYAISHKNRPDRGEPLVRLFWHYYHASEWEKAFSYAHKIKTLECPIEHDAWQVEINAYFENSWELRDAVGVTYQRMGSEIKNKGLLEEGVEIFQGLEKKFTDSDEEQLERVRGNIKYMENELNNL
jgi:hypothetical protein